MEFLKKSWKVILGVIGFFIGLVWMMNSNSSKKVKKIKKDIRGNENKTSEVDGKLKYIKKAETNKKLKDSNNKKPKVKKKTAKQAAQSLKDRLKK